MSSELEEKRGEKRSKSNARPMTIDRLNGGNLNNEIELALHFMKHISYIIGCYQIDFMLLISSFSRMVSSSILFEHSQCDLCLSLTLSLLTQRRGKNQRMIIGLIILYACHECIASHTCKERERENEQAEEKWGSRRREKQTLSGSIAEQLNYECFFFSARVFCVCCCE